eukprot:1160427-Pelagomonas_calceolata.AAC.1
MGQYLCHPGTKRAAAGLKCQPTFSYSGRKESAWLSIEQNFAADDTHPVHNSARKEGFSCSFYESLLHLAGTTLTALAVLVPSLNCCTSTYSRIQ